MAFRARLNCIPCVFRLLRTEPNLHSTTAEADADMPDAETLRPVDGSAPQGITSARHGAALAGLALATLIASLAVSIANIGVPAIGHAFEATPAASQWVLLAYLLATTVAVVGIGALGDRYGRRRILLAGVGLFAAAAALAASAGTLGVLIAARVAQGLGAAAMTALAIAAAGSVVPPERRGGAIGLIGATSAVGTALGPALGGALLALFDWRALFAALLPAALLTWHLLFRSLPLDPARRAAPAAVDGLGMAALATTLVSYAFALSIGPRYGIAVVLPLLAACAIGIGLLVHRQRHASSPLLDPALLLVPTLRNGLVASSLLTAVVMTSLVVGPFYLGRGLGLDPARTGLVMAIGPLVSAATGVPAGRWVDRRGSAGPALAGLASMALGAGGLALLPSGLGVPGYALFLALLTAGYASFQAANSTEILGAVAAERRGVVAGLVQLARNLGLVSGVALMAAVAGNTLPTPAEALDGLHRAFGAALGLVIVAALLARRRG